MVSHEIDFCDESRSSTKFSMNTTTHDTLATYVKQADLICACIRCVATIQSHIEIDDDYQDLICKITQNSHENPSM